MQAYAEVTEKQSKQSRLMYILEAGLEYLVALAVGGSFLATLTSSLGMEDSLTGILTSFVSLGCLFEMFSIGIRVKRSKPILVLVSVANQLLFMMLYIIPLMGGSQPLKITLFMIALFMAYVLLHICAPKKTVLFMDHVDAGIRGRFTANKEMVSLVMGMLFSLGMGAMVDHFKEQGDLRTAFTLGAIVVFVLCILHTGTLLFTAEKVRPLPEKKEGFLKRLYSTARNATVRKVVGLGILWFMSQYATTSFYGTYQIKELGFSLTFVSVLAMVGSIARILVSRAWGAYADKHSFAKMAKLSMLVIAAAFLCATFATPKNGKILFTMYSVIHAIAMGGANSAIFNMIFEYVPSEYCTDAIALKQALSGLAGFLTTLVMSGLVSHIQQQGNQLFGLPIYAQQVTSFVALTLVLLTVLYADRVVGRLKKTSEE